MRAVLIAIDAPVISIGSAYNPLAVTLGSSVAFDCSADANPPVNVSAAPIRWTKNNVTVG